MVLFNPPLTSASAFSSYHLPIETLEPSFHLFTQQLYSLLALPPLPKSISASPPPSPLQRPSDLVQPISAWQIDAVLRMRARENSEEARKTLAGIARLVAKIREMKVGEGVRGKVLGAVERLEQVRMATPLPSR